MSTTEPVDTLETTGAYPKYGEYEDSGVEWLGEIPARWDVLSLKYAAQIVQDKLDEKPETLPYLGLEHIESETGRLVKEEPSEDVSSTVRHFKEGDVLFSKLRPYLAKVYLAETEGVGTTELIALRSKTDVCERYIAYQLLSKGFIDRVDSMTYGAKMPRVSPKQVGSRQIALPSLAEQRAIATFLDRETERIDALIERKEQLIDLLEEKRTALISRVVTKGLDGDVEMQDSGVEWLGGIPAHWETGKVAHLFDNLDSERIPVSSSNRADMQGEYPYYGASGVIDHVDDYLFDEPLILVAEDGANLLSRSTPLAFVARGKYWVNNHAHILRPRYEPLEYWAYVLRSIVYDPWITGSAQPKLNQENLDSIELPMPPEKERLRITERLNDERLQINHLIDKVEEGIDRLKEYRTALISAAVTGQIDVCEEVPAAPVE